MKLFKHQQDIVNEDPKKCGLFLGTGSGKSATALSLAQGRTLVICPKTTRDDKTWENNLKKLGKVLNLTVVSKEEFRRDYQNYSKYDTIICDEAHFLCGVSPSTVWRQKKQYPKTSQLFDGLQEYLIKHPPERLYLLTATPIRSPMSVYALGRLLGRQWDFYEFRSVYYFPIRVGGHDVWTPKKDTETQERLGKCVRGLGYTGQLSDWLDVPEQTHVVKNIPLTKEQEHEIASLPLLYPDPIVLLGKKHQVEQGVLKGNEFEISKTFKSGKIEAIHDLYEEFGKVLVFAKYTEQIELIADHFTTEEVPVYILNGQTKDRGLVIEQAEKQSRCVVIAQSSISAGYELPSFRCTVYASEDYSFVNHSQSLGRTLRINNLQKNLYVYLVSGEIDKAVRSALETKNDFNSKIYLKI
jgi:hypothetical protein